MASPLLDFKKFKHIKSDAKSTTLQHKDGHTLTIAHNVLSKPHQEQLKALSKIASEAQTSSQEQESQDKSQYGKTIMKSEGGQIQENPKLEESHKTPPEQEHCMHCGGKIKMYADNQDFVSKQDSAPTVSDPIVINNPDYFKQAEQAYPATISPEQQKYQSEIDAAKQRLEAENMTRQGNVPGGMGVQPRSEGQIQAEAEHQVLSKMPPKPQEQVFVPENASNTVQQAKEPIEQEVTPPAQPTQYAPQITSHQEASAIPSTMRSEDMAWDQDLKNGHITPQTYGDLFAKKDTLGKIGTMFGILASSMGSGITGQANMVLGMMDKEIERDLEAQKTSKTNAINFHTLANQHAINQANIGHLGMQDKLMQRELATQSMWRTALQDQWNKIQKIQDPAAKQAAMSAYNVMSSGIDAKLQNAESAIAAKQAFAQGMLGGQQGESNEQAFQNKIRLYEMTPGMENIAKELKGTHFPGIPGRSTQELDKEDRAQITNGIDFDQKLNRFIAWTKSHSGDIKPKDRNVGQTLAAELQGAYRQATNGGVYKEGEQNFISKLIDSTPTKFFNEVRVLPQLEALKNEHAHRMNTLTKSKGFDGYPSSFGRQEQDSQTESTGPSIGTTSTNKSTGARMIYTKSGWEPYNG